MKTTSWLWPILTLLCATRIVCTAQRGSYGAYPLENIDSQLLQNDYYVTKRNKPSLSIVNPLDVLRQRLLLEIARRQMKENTRQVELNRAILNNVGKRMAGTNSSPLSADLYDVHELQQHQQQQQQQHHQPEAVQYEYELIPTTLFFDYLQRQQEQEQQQQQQPWLPYNSNALQLDSNYINDAIFSATASEDDPEIARENAEQNIITFNGLVGNNGKHSMRHLKQSNNERSTTPNEQQQQRQETATFQKSINNRNDDTKRFTLINNHHQLHQQKNDLTLDPNDANPIVDVSKNEMKTNGDDYQTQRYLYHLHKNQNHLTRK